MFPKIIDWHNRGVFQPGNRLGFALEARRKFFIVHKLARQDLDSHLAVKLRVMCEIDDRHTPAA